VRGSDYRDDLVWIKLKLFQVLTLSRRMRLSLFERSGEAYQSADFDAGLHKLVAADGGDFLALLPRFRNGPDSLRFNSPLDGHPTPAGYAFLTYALIEQLTAGTIPALGTRAEGDVTGIKDADGGVLTARVSYEREQRPRNVGVSALLMGVALT
jgi:hypothetical protein